MENFAINPADITTVHLNAVNAVVIISAEASHLSVWLYRAGDININASASQYPTNTLHLCFEIKVLNSFRAFLQRI